MRIVRSRFLTGALFRRTPGPLAWRQPAFASATVAKQHHIDIVADRQKRSSRDVARAFRAVPISVITVSKGSRAAEELAEDFATKIKRYTAFHSVVIRTNPKKTSNPEVAVQAEGTKVLQAVRPQDRVIALDERGKDITSEAFARLLAQAGDCGAGRLVFCIGGPFGHAQGVIDRADELVKLSNCVLNHQVANIVLLEQIYRGFTILRQACSIAIELIWHTNSKVVRCITRSTPLLCTAAEEKGTIIDTAAIDVTALPQTKEESLTTRRQKVLSKQVQW